MKPTWITVNPTSGVNNGSSETVVTSYTGRSNRTGTLTGETDSGVTDTVALTQKGKAEFITVTKVDYTVDAVGNTVAISGTSNSANIKVKEDTGSSIAGVTYKIAVNKVDDTSWNGDSDTGIDGDPGASKEYSFVITATVPENKSASAKTHVVDLVNGNENVTSDTITITQAAGVKNYANPVISSLSYALIPAKGGTSTPTITYSQTWGWNTSNTNGGTLTSGGTVKYSGTNVNTSTGAVTAPSLGTTIKDQTVITTASATVTLNGKTSAAKTAQVSQAENQATYGDVVITGGTVSDIPAAGGSVKTASNVTTSQLITFDSEDTKQGKVTLSYSPSVGIEGQNLGTVVTSRAKKGTLILTATGEGGETATKSFDVYQAANTATYGEVSLTALLTPVTLLATGETYALDTKTEAAFSQTVTFTSGGRLEDAENFDSATYTVKTAKDGFSVSAAGKVTVTENPGTTARNGFVVTVTATGAGSKTATKDITFNQAGSDSYIRITPESLTFEATGGTKTITIESNDSWTIS